MPATVEMTYAKRLAARNGDRLPCLRSKGGCGEIHEWLTARDCIPAIFPDHAEGGPLALERLPDDVEGIEIG